MSPPNRAGSLLLANLAAEEGERWPDHAGEPAVVTTVRLWQLLFSPAAKLLPARGSGDPLARADWPADLGPEPDAAAFDWLGRAAGLVPWLSTSEARDRADEREVALDAPAAEVVTRVHDKSFALRFSRAEGYEPRPLRGLGHHLDAELLSRPDDALEAVASWVAEWPDWTGGRFTLKPCLGSSGRGRCAGVGPDFDRSSLRGALPRLAERGGALLEPWLRRSCDLSAQMWIGEQEDLLMLGTSLQHLSPAGLYLGQRGEIDSRGRVFSGSPWEEAVREAAAAIARAARAEGFHGPCGVDAFAFQGPGSGAEDDDGRQYLRPIVELNARFTSGIIAIGLLRRAHARIREQTGIAPGERRAFHLGLAAPAGGWAQAVSRCGGTLFHLSEGETRDDEGPGLLVTDTLSDLERLAP